MEALEARGAVLFPAHEAVGQSDKGEGEGGAVCVPVHTPDGEVLGALQVGTSAQHHGRSFVTYGSFVLCGDGLWGG